ncbi:MAG: 4Fe-4S binding protein [Deltaproteobacteria bacterium]|nr:4Fe-4S binding protein [Deltaproteobacteria bacterium]
MSVAWRAAWKVARAAATPWMRRELDRAKKLLLGPPRDLTIPRASIDQALADAAPPGVPYDAAVLPSEVLRARFPEGPPVRRGRHLVGKFRMTHREVPTPAVLVFALYSDVAADYFVESMAADIAAALDRAHGKGTALADTQADIPTILKEFAVAAGLGVIGKNALFFSRQFGFNCKLAVVFLNAPVDRYDAAPTNTEWKLADCTGCTLCVEACPVGAFDDFRMNKVEDCDRMIAADYFGPRRDHMCRACITRCPVSNDVLKLRRSEGAPQRLFWDNEAQLSLAADLFMYKPSFWVWVLQRFYYGASMRGRPERERKSPSDALTSSVTVATSDRTRDGWRITARKKR